jgi:uridine kinase
LHPRIVAALTRIIRRHRAPSVIAIDGGTGLGKSTLARQLARALGESVIIGTDSYVLPRHARYALGLAAQDPHAMQLHVLLQDLDLLINQRRSIERSTYNHHTGSNGPPVTRAPARVTIIEGIHSLSPAVRRVIPVTLGIFLTASEPVMRAARYRRDAACGNVTDWPERWATLYAGHQRFITPYEQHAHLTISIGENEAHINRATLPRACTSSCASRQHARNSASRRRRPSASSSSAPSPLAHDETR